MSGKIDSTSRWASGPRYHCGHFWKIRSAMVIIHVVDLMMDRKEGGGVGVWEGNVLLKCQGL